MYLENQTDSLDQTSFLQKDKFFVFVVPSLASSHIQGVLCAQTDTQLQRKECRKFKIASPKAPGKSQ